MNLTDTLLHRWMRIPYALHTSIREARASKNPPTIIFLHGIGNSGDAWQDVIDKLPDTYRIITIDLLGFGKSPQPDWMTYDAKHQARAVMATYLRLRVYGRVTLVGHSLGALVAVEMAKRYPLLIKSLVLCSPPFYKIDEKKRRLLPSSDQLLQEMYRLAKKHPGRFIKISDLALKLGLVNKSYNLSVDNAAIYMNALEATIINQTSLKDATKIDLPMHIIYGRLDPVVVAKNLRFLARINKQVTFTAVLAGHEIMGPFVRAVVSVIKQTVSEK